jgi:hypothetical protein
VRRSAVVILAAAVLVSSLAWKRRAVERQIEADADETDRYVDMGVTLTVVEMDRERANAMERAGGWLPDVPPVKIVDTLNLGGMLDTWQGEIVGPSVNPRQWRCSPQQAPLILHDDDAPLWSLVQGSEGAGKSTTGAMWLYMRVLEHVGHNREIGVTAPVRARLGHVIKAIGKLWDPKWYRWKERDQSYRFRAGPLVQLVSAHQQSEDAGSPIQGANWVACLSDELQDHHDRNDDIVARGRDAPGGRYKRLCTSTFKDSSEWRDFRDVVAKSPEWRFAKLLGLDSPFQWPRWWATIKAGGITDREWRRRVLAMDVGLEAQLYHCWSRKLEDGSPGNLRPIPLGADDVTAEVLAPYLPRGGVLIGHDPGKRQHVSMFLKAYRFRGERTIRWFVVDEVTTNDATIEKHVAEVMERVRKAWRCNLKSSLDGRPDPYAPQALVRIDPHTRSGDEHPGRDLYAVWRNAGLVARAAAYNPGASDPAVIKRESRFDMMNTLLCDVNGERRLLVACDDQGSYRAQKLVKALESMERDAAGKGEADKKDGNDLSHWPAAVGYALWQIEHPRTMAVNS